MYRKGSINPDLYRKFVNSPTEMFDYTMSNLMDTMYASQLRDNTDGTFKGVCLSGFQTGNNTGTSNNSLDGFIDIQDGGFYLIIRPLGKIGDIVPDPRQYSGDENQIIQSIVLHSTVFLAKADYGYSDSSPINFGQVVNCYFEDGSIINSSFKNLVFQEPNGNPVYLPSYRDLANVSSSTSGSAANWGSASTLGDVSTATENPENATAEGKSANIKGDRNQTITHIVIHYSAANGSKKSVLSYENRSTEYGYHYMIDRDGSHYDSAPPEKIVWHSAGNKLVGNKNSVGICIMNVGYERDGVPAKQNWITGKYPNANKTGKWEPYTEASINKCVEICAELCKNYNIPVSNIVGHSDIQNNKSDPGPAFNLQNFRTKVSEKI